MLGPPKSRDLDQPVLISLEALVPADHFYRRLDAALDRSCTREWVQRCDAERGRPSLDPVVFCKLERIAFFAGLRSERQLVATASLNLAHRWYLGYRLDEPLPDHSTLSKIRRRLGLPIFRRFFEYVVELCQQAGLVWGQELLADATKVRANASLDSLAPRLKEVVDGHLVDLFGGGSDAADASARPPEEPIAPPPLHPAALSQGAPGPDQPGAAAEGEPAKRWDVLEACRLDPDRPPSGGYQRLSARRVSRTDPDATPMAMADQRTALG